MNQKAAKTITLLIGMRRPEIAELLIPRGLTNEVIQDGWQLFNRATELRMNVMAQPMTGASPNLVKELDTFENRYLALTKAVLARHYPAESDLLFNGLGRAEGRAVTYTVDFFLRRLDAMDKGEAPFEARGPEVRAFLRTRGLSDAIVAEGTSLVTALQSIGTREAPSTSAQELLAAEEAMWGFYREWAVVARLTIKDGRLLRQLGFKKRSYVYDAELVEEEEEEGEELLVTGTTINTPALPAPSAAAVADDDKEDAAE
jgi:hypothetical protein